MHEQFYADAGGQAHGSAALREHHLRRLHDAQATRTVGPAVDHDVGGEHAIVDRGHQAHRRLGLDGAGEIHGALIGRHQDHVDADDRFEDEPIHHIALVEADAHFSAEEFVECTDTHGHHVGLKLH